MAAGSNEELQALLEGLDFETRTLYAEAALGRDAVEFMRSELGRTMVGFARQDYADAMVALVKTPWWRPRAIRRHQDKARHAEAFASYLRELVLRGQKAEQVLDSGEE